MSALWLAGCAASAAYLVQFSRTSYVAQDISTTLLACLFLTAATLLCTRHYLGKNRGTNFGSLSQEEVTILRNKAAYRLPGIEDFRTGLHYEVLFVVLLIRSVHALRSATYNVSTGGIILEPLFPIILLLTAWLTDTQTIWHDVSNSIGVIMVCLTSTLTLMHHQPAEAAYMSIAAAPFTWHTPVLQLLAALEDAIILTCLWNIVASTRRQGVTIGITAGNLALILIYLAMTLTVVQKFGLVPVDNAEHGITIQWAQLRDIGIAAVLGSATVVAYLGASSYYGPTIPVAVCQATISATLAMSLIYGSDTAAKSVLDSVRPSLDFGSLATSTIVLIQSSASVKTAAGTTRLNDIVFFSMQSGALIVLAMHVKAWYDNKRQL